MKGTLLGLPAHNYPGPDIPPPDPPPDDFIDVSVFTRVTGGLFNNVIYNKTSGPGLDYPTGVVGLAAGDWIFNPINLGASPLYKRAFNAAKPFNNWLIIVEADGPGTVRFNLAADSTGLFSYTVGGGFYVIGDGSLRLCFYMPNALWENGAIRFEEGATGNHPDRVYWFGGTYKYEVEEWNRQNAATGGDQRMKGNWQCTPFRFHAGVTRCKIMRVLIDEAGDDGVFIGGGSSYIDVIGTGISRIFNKGYNSGEFHNDDIQITGGNPPGGEFDGAHHRILDCTLEGHGGEIMGEAGQTLDDIIVDRVWMGNSGIVGMFFGTNGGATNANVILGAGGPEGTRIPGTQHFFKVFGNGKSYPGDTIPQTASADSLIGWQVGLINYPHANHHGVYLNVTLEKPVNVTLNPANGFMTSNLISFMESPDVPHMVFRSVYAEDDLGAVMADYDIEFD